MENKILKAGIVGAGNISTNAHLPAYQNIKTVKVQAIADINIELAKKAAEKYGIPEYYGSVEEMLEKSDIDYVDVCTWNNGHAPVTIAAAKAGKHVICEKPMTISVEDGIKMKEAIEKAGVKFMLAVPGRFGNSNTYVHDMLEKGELGEVYFAKTNYVRRRGTPYGWFTDKKTSGGGPVIDIGIHGIDAAWYLMGCPKPTRISASTFSFIGDYKTKGVDRWMGQSCPDNKFDTEDSGAGIIHFENGASLLFEATWATNGVSHSDTQIFGSKAGVNLSPLTIYGERDGYLSDDNITMPSADPRFQREIEHFVDCIQNDKPVRYNIDMAIDMQKMLCGIYKSAETHKEVIL